MYHKEKGFFKRNRKSNAVLDSLSVVLTLFVFGLIAIVSFVAMQDVNQDIQNSADVHEDAKQLMSDSTANFPSWFDGAFLFILILLWATTLISSFMINTHPIFFIISILLLLFVLYMGMVLANTFEEITSDSELESSADAFVYTRFVFSHMVEIIIAIGISIMIVLYGKLRS